MPPVQEALGPFHTKEEASMAEKFIFPDNLLSILVGLPSRLKATFLVIYLVHTVVL